MLCAFVRPSRLMDHSTIVPSKTDQHAAALGGRGKGRFRSEYVSSDLTGGRKVEMFQRKKTFQTYLSLPTRHRNIHKAPRVCDSLLCAALGSLLLLLRFNLNCSQNKPRMGKRVSLTVTLKFWSLATTQQPRYIFCLGYTPREI